MSRYKKIKHDAVYFFLGALVGIINFLPRRTSLFLGSLLGLSAWRLLPRERHRISRHLGFVFGDSLTPAEKSNIGRTFFLNSGKNIIDVIRMRKYFGSEVWPHVKMEGLEHFDRAYHRGRGVIGVTGHIGNFEMLAAIIAAAGYKAAAIGRELYDPRVDRFLNENRQAMGLNIMATTDSPRKLLSWVKDGGTVGVLIDTDSSRVRGIFIPVFGRLAQSAVGHAMLGLKTGAAFVPLACIREKDNSYRLIIRPEITIERTEDFEADVAHMTLKCSRAMEEIICEYPEQWIWLHNRWCARPEKTA